jgi:hypothetical protein
MGGLGGGGGEPCETAVQGSSCVQDVGRTCACFFLVLATCQTLLRQAVRAWQSAASVCLMQLTLSSCSSIPIHWHANSDGFHSPLLAFLPVVSDCTIHVQMVHALFRIAHGCMRPAWLRRDNLCC